MKIPLAFLADYATTTQDGKLIIMGIFDSIKAAYFPVTHPKMQLVLRIEGHSREFEAVRQFEITISGADGEGVAGLDFPFTLPRKPRADRLRIEQIIDINLVKFPRAGDYSVEVSIDGIRKASIPLEVTLIADSGVPDQSGGTITGSGFEE